MELDDCENLTGEFTEYDELYDDQSHFHDQLCLFKHPKCLIFYIPRTEFLHAYYQIKFEDNIIEIYLVTLEDMYDVYPVRYCSDSSHIYVGLNINLKITDILSNIKFIIKNDFPIEDKWRTKQFNINMPWDYVLFKHAQDEYIKFSADFDIENMRKIINKLNIMTALQ